jgi:polynucleotide 5'-hydroxyl-kinase GRC3/NOL9
LSAIAAARLKAEQAASPITNPDGIQEPPPSPLADSTASEAAESEPEDISLIPQNFKLSTWRRIQTNILSDSPSELTIVLDKNTTASFVGCFDVRVLKGAVNINGANIGAAAKGSKESASTHRVYVPSTHPITKIRGLDRTNHVELRSCQEPTPFADMNPLFDNIWGAGATNDNNRSFTWVSSPKPFFESKY